MPHRVTAGFPAGPALLRLSTEGVAPIRQDQATPCHPAPYAGHEVLTS